MTILLHPRKDSAERYRVWDCETSTQKYFPLTAEGKRQAEEFEQRIVKIKKARALSRDLAMNKLFEADGSVKGMKRRIRERNGRENDVLRLYAKLKTNELSIGKRCFDETYKLACEWILKQHGIEETREIRQAFKNARKLYWTSPKAEEESMPFWKQFFR